MDWFDTLTNKMQGCFTTTFKIVYVFQCKYGNPAVYVNRMCKSTITWPIKRDSEV